MKNELSQSFAEEIGNRHREAEALQQGAMTEIMKLIEARTQTAEMVATARANAGAGFRAWWRDLGLPEEWAAKYLRIHRTSQRNRLGDRNQLQLIGLLPEPDGASRGTGTQRKANPFQWINYCGKLAKSLDEIDIEAMDDFERDAAADQLKPIVERYRRLRGETA